MEAWGRELLTGIAGAIIGPALIYLFSFGFKWTRQSREERQKLKATEIADWKSGDAVKRQRIFNLHLFSVLKFFIVGSTLIAVSSTISDFNAGGPNPKELGVLDYLAGALDTTGAIFYLATFAQILQFMKLLKAHS